MNSKHKTTLAIIFAIPTPTALEWARIEALPLAAGWSVVEGDGSRVRFVHGEHVANFYRPHTAKEAKRYQIADCAARGSRSLQNSRRLNT